MPQYCVFEDDDLYRYFFVYRNQVCVNFRAFELLRRTSLEIRKYNITLAKTTSILKF